MPNQRDKTRINRQVTLKSLLVFTTLVAASIALTMNDSVRVFGYLVSWGLIGGVIGFFAGGRWGFWYGFFILPVVFLVIAEVLA